jgi:predicted regulator of Ras-like GTPase activity (Roadblock/LC7/MglB family)
MLEEFVKPLQARLHNELHKMADARAMVIVSRDGVVLATTIATDTATNGLNECTSLLEIAQRLLTTLESGQLSQLFVSGANGYVIVTPLESQAVLVTATEARAKLSLMVFDLKHLADELGALLKE